MDVLVLMMKMIIYYNIIIMKRINKINIMRNHGRINIYIYIQYMYIYSNNIKFCICINDILNINILSNIMHNNVLNIPNERNCPDNFLI
mmetsp:Transcript_76671/g.94124  ORF Transcript_76671/g.94124 Transcript_76671/m.94124 type:complete len:89 (+) Transcript_76671:313-579(+)